MADLEAPRRLPGRTKEVASTRVPTRESVGIFTPPQRASIVRQHGVPLPGRFFLRGSFLPRAFDFPIRAPRLPLIFSYVFLPRNVHVYWS